MTHSIREALIAMSYTEAKPGKWIKPIGHQCFAYNEEHNKWDNYFLNQEGEISLWDSKTFIFDTEHFGPYIHQLKGFEFGTRTDIYNPKSEFELMAIDL